MNVTARWNKVLTVVMLATMLLASGCGPGQLFGPTITPSPTLTPTPSDTPTPTLTPTLAATATNTLPPTATLTPTAVPAMGTPISSADWQITVVKAKLRRILVNAPYYWRPGDGHLFLDVGIHFKRLKGGKSSIDTVLFFLKDKNGDQWQLISSATADAKGDAPFDPFSIGLKCTGCTVEIEGDDVYVRLFYWGGSDAQKDPFDLFFKDVPPIEFNPEPVD